MGVPWVPDGRYVAPGLGWGGLRKKNASYDSIERVLLILTLLISGSGKRACFGGKCCYLRALMGVPGVPDGQYVGPCQGWGGLRREKASYGDFERVILVFTERIDLFLEIDGNWECTTRTGTDSFAWEMQKLKNQEHHVLKKSIWKKTDFFQNAKFSSVCSWNLFPF